MFEVYNSKNGPCVIECPPDSLYQFKVYTGKHVIYADSRNSYWFINGNTVYSMPGSFQKLITSEIMCVEIFGYTPEMRTSTFIAGTDLPYVNGCSTKQLIPAARPGDPTFQMLLIPAGCSEQEHHIHATPRIVYVAKGSGISVVGMQGNKKTIELHEGDVIVLGKMVPHHFETVDEDLIVLPVHVFSSGKAEFDHPMYNGTHRV